MTKTQQQRRKQKKARRSSTRVPPPKKMGNKTTALLKLLKAAGGVFTFYQAYKKGKLQGIQVYNALLWVNKHARELGLSPEAVEKITSTVTQIKSKMTMEQVKALIPPLLQAAQKVEGVTGASPAVQIGFALTLALYDSATGLSALHDLSKPGLTLSQRYAALRTVMGELFKDTPLSVSQLRRKLSGEAGFEFTRDAEGKVTDIRFKNDKGDISKMFVMDDDKNLSIFSGGRGAPGGGPDDGPDDDDGDDSFRGLHFNGGGGGNDGWFNWFSSSSPPDDRTANEVYQDKLAVTFGDPLKYMESSTIPGYKVALGGELHKSTTKQRTAEEMEQDAIEAFQFARGLNSRVNVKGMEFLAAQIVLNPQNQTLIDLRDDLLRIRGNDADQYQTIEDTIRKMKPEEQQQKAVDSHGWFSFLTTYLPTYEQSTMLAKNVGIFTALAISAHVAKTAGLAAIRTVPIAGDLVADTLEANPEVGDMMMSATAETFSNTLEYVTGGAKVNEVNSALQKLREIVGEGKFKEQNFEGLMKNDGKLLSTGGVMKYNEMRRRINPNENYFEQAFEFFKDAEEAFPRDAKLREIRHVYDELSELSKDPEVIQFYKTDMLAIPEDKSYRQRLMEGVKGMWTGTKNMMGKMGGGVKKVGTVAKNNPKSAAAVAAAAAIGTMYMLSGDTEEEEVPPITKEEISKLFFDSTPADTSTAVMDTSDKMKNAVDTLNQHTKQDFDMDAYLKLLKEYETENESYLPEWMRRESRKDRLYRKLGVVDDTDEVREAVTILEETHKEKEEEKARAKTDDPLVSPSVTPSPKTDKSKPASSSYPPPPPPPQTRPPPQQFQDPFSQFQRPLGRAPTGTRTQTQTQTSGSAPTRSYTPGPTPPSQEPTPEPTPPFAPPPPSMDEEPDENNPQVNGLTAGYFLEDRITPPELLRSRRRRQFRPELKPLKYDWKNELKDRERLRTEMAVAEFNFVPKNNYLGLFNALANGNDEAMEKIRYRYPLYVPVTEPPQWQSPVAPPITNYEERVNYHAAHAQYTGMRPVYERSDVFQPRYRQKMSDAYPTHQWIPYNELQWAKRDPITHGDYFEIPDDNLTSRE